MKTSYGTQRVMEPKYVLPTSAWKLDNSRKIYPDELRLSVMRIHLEGTSFKQICTEVNNNEEKIKQKIMDIVIRRGKLHNPITDTGGLVLGIVEEIGDEYYNPKGLKPGDRVICNASLASVPLHIENIKSIDYVFNQAIVEGYAIAHDNMQLIQVEEGMPVELLLFTLDESGTVMRLDQLIDKQTRFLIVGNNMITNLLFGYVIRRKVGKEGRITCVLDKRTGIQITGGGIDRLLAEVFDQIHSLDILKPMEALEKLNAESLFDLSVNCAEIPGAETINLLATRNGGTVLFANLINNLNIALYITESISKNLNLRSAEGYLTNYDDFDVQIVKETAEYFENASLHKASAKEGTESISMQYNRTLLENSMLEDFVFSSRLMQNVLNDIMNVSKYDCNVLIYGETGVGKEKVANLIQKNSDRKMQPFVKINCGAISPSLIESEFFGYEKGAFTGASTSGRKGYFETANNGVIFLDEIGELPLEMQAKLLRAIQDGEFYRVGGTTPVKTNVRILSKDSRKFGTSRGIVDSAMDYLKQLPWPGNVRELENVVQRLIISAKGEDITLMDVMKETHSEIFEGGVFSDGEENDVNGAAGGVQIDLQQAVDEYEKGLIKYACEKYGSTRKAAKARHSLSERKKSMRFSQAKCSKKQ